MAGFLFGGGAASIANLTYFKNVKAYGAVGDGVTNDQPAIQAAVDDTTFPYSSTNRGVIFFPEGIYQLNSSVTFELSDGIQSIGFLGSPGALIRGDFADALLKRSPDSPVSYACFVENLRFQNGNAAGKCLLFHSMVGGTVINCAFAGVVCVETFNSQSVTIQDCSMSSGGIAGALGIDAGNATSIISCDITGLSTGIRHSNLGLIVHGGRIEVCTVGIQLGYLNVDVFTSTGFDIAGISMESNNTGIYLYSAVAGKISACSPTASKPSMVSGYRLGSVQDTVIEAAAFASSDGGWSQAGVWLDNSGTVSNVTFNSILSIDASSVSSWSIPTGVNSITLNNCNVELTVTQLPVAARIGTILPVKDSTSVAIGAAITTGGNSNHYAAVAGASGSWIRAA